MIIFENYIKNQREKLLNGADIYGLHFQGDGATIKDTPILNILAGGVCLPVSVQKIVYCTGHITGGHKKDSKFVADSFFDKMNELSPSNICRFTIFFSVSSSFILSKKLSATNLHPSCDQL